MNSRKLIDLLPVIFTVGVLLIATVTFLSIYNMFSESSRIREENERHIKLVKTEIRTFELLKRTSPKHFYVWIKDIKNGQIVEHVYVSKHCNTWRETAVVGQLYKIPTLTYLDDRNGASIISYSGLYGVFCR